MKTDSHLNRRTFLGATIRSTAALGFSSLAGAAPPGVIRLPVSQARAISAGADGLLAIAADREILFWTIGGERSHSITTGRPVRALCHDAAGKLWMTFSDQVARLTDAGEIETIGANLGRETALTGIALADDGRIFAADSGQRVIWRLDAGGKVLGQIRAGEKGFVVPRAFFPLTWQSGQLVVAEPGRHRVLRFTAEGELVSHWGRRSRDETGFAGCCNPAALAALADGSVATVERGQARVKRFDSAGKLLAELAGPDAFAHVATEEDAGDLFGCDGGLLDIAATNDGRIAVLDRAAREVRVLG